MKLSCYNYEEDNGNNYILYNCRTDELLFLNEELKTIWLNKSTSQLEEIRDIHPKFFNYLIAKGFVVPEHMNEQDAVLSKLFEEDKREDCFSIIINPTLNCNMRCWYCYEKHIADSYMSRDIMDRILRLVNKKVANPKLKNFAVSFFGGEPLLAFDDCVFLLLREIDEICIRENKSFSVSFTSNAFLLNDDVISKLLSLHLDRPINWQITLDGGRALHNKNRHTADKQGTYDIIVANIHRALASNMEVMVRLNFRYNALLTFLDVIDSFKEHADVYKRNLSFCFQQIWQDAPQCGNTRELDDALMEVKQAYKAAGLRVVENTDIPTRCYADKPNSVVINYDGEVYKCTAQDFNKETSEGCLDRDGDIHPNSKYYERMNSRYANKYCISCKIFPLCFGGCSQKLLFHQDKCCRNFDKKGIIEFIRKRIQHLAGFINNN